MFSFKFPVSCHESSKKYSNKQDDFLKTCVDFDNSGST